MGDGVSHEEEAFQFALLSSNSDSNDSLYQDSTVPGHPISTRAWCVRSFFFPCGLTDSACRLTEESGNYLCAA